MFKNIKNKRKCRFPNNFVIAKLANIYQVKKNLKAHNA